MNIFREIEEVTNDSEIQVLEAMIESYSKMAVIMENYDMDDMDNIAIFTEAATNTDSEKDEDKKPGAISRIINFIKKLISTFFGKIRSLFVKSKEQSKNKPALELSKDDVEKLSNKAKAAGIAGAFAVTLGAGGLVFVKKSEIKEKINDKIAEKKDKEYYMYDHTRRWDLEEINRFIKPERDSNRRRLWRVITFVNVDLFSDEYYYFTINTVDLENIINEVKTRFDDLHDKMTSYLKYEKIRTESGKSGHTKGSFERKTILDFNAILDEAKLGSLMNRWQYPENIQYGNYKAKHGEPLMKAFDDAMKFLADKTFSDRISSDFENFVKRYEETGADAYKWNKRDAKKIEQNDDAKFSKKTDVRTDYTERYLQGKITEVVKAITDLLLTLAKDIMWLKKECDSQIAEMEKKIKTANIEHEEFEKREHERIWNKIRKDEAEKAAEEASKEKESDKKDDSDKDEKEKEMINHD